mgnify:CR=1 FL=1
MNFYHDFFFLFSVLIKIKKITNSKNITISPIRRKTHSTDFFLGSYKDPTKIRIESPNADIIVNQEYNPIFK